ncbi:MAG: helix-turn-helix transcriptional regulator [Victivallales bacterium]
MSVNGNDIQDLFPKTPKEVMSNLASKAKVLRLKADLTQSGLASRSGVSLGSIKRFEKTGEISLRSLLNIALVLRRLEDFEKIFSSEDMPMSLFNEEPRTQRQRGRRK